MIDLKLDMVTHDLLIDTDLTLIDGLDYLEQKIKITLWFFFAEWFLDTTIGIKYMESVFIKNPNLTLIDSLFKVAIVGINGVQALTAYDSTYYNTERRFDLEFTVKADLGELSLTQEITL